MTKSKIHRDAFDGQFITAKSAKKRPARSVAEPRTGRKRPGVPAHFAALSGDVEEAVILVGGEKIYVPLASLPTKAGVGDELILRFECLPAR